MDFAIVMPAYNAAEHILEAIGSCTDQELVAEIIVVDDGSNDETVSLARAVADRRVRTLHQDNAGPGAARNNGLRDAQASHVIFLDADDLLLPGATTAFAALHAAGHAIARTGVDYERAGGAADTVLAEPAPGPYPNGSPLPGSFSIERSILDAIAGYDVRFRFAENSELLLRAQVEATRVGATCGYGTEPTVFHGRDGGRPADFYEGRRLDAVELMLELHRGALAQSHDALADHLAIASELRRAAGDRGAARRHALDAAKVRPRSLRSWARVVRAAVN